PGIIAQQLQRIASPARLGLTASLQKLLREMLDQLENVIAPLAQRRDRQRNNLQSEVEIFAERSFPHGALEIVVRGGDNAYVGANDAVTADALDFFRLDRAQQLRLCVGAEIADFVKKQRSMMRQLEAADALRCRAGESAPLVAEHLAFDEIARDRRTIHANERLVASDAAVVDGAGHELLAGSRLSGDKDARIGRRHARDHL